MQATSRSLFFHLPPGPIAGEHQEKTGRMLPFSHKWVQPVVPKDDLMSPGPKCTVLADVEVPDSIIEDADLSCRVTVPVPHDRRLSARPEREAWFSGFEFPVVIIIEIPGTVDVDPYLGCVILIPVSDDRRPSCTTETGIVGIAGIEFPVAMIIEIPDSLL